MFYILNTQTNKKWLWGFGTRERAQYRIDNVHLLHPELVDLLDVREK